MATKSGSRAASDKLSAAVGVVIDIDDNLVALVRMRTGEQRRIRADMLPGKSAPPRVGETWILDQRHGIGWQFATPVNWTADVDWVHLSPSGAWTVPTGAWLPLGAQRDAGGWVTLCGRVSGGVAATTATILPVGYRPGGDWLQIVPAGSGSGQLLVTSAGLVKPQTATSPISLDSVRFLATG